MSPAEPRVTRVDLVRASAQMALLRVDVDGLEAAPSNVEVVATKANEPEQRIFPLPTPSPSEGPTRFSFALPMTLRLARIVLVVDDFEKVLAVPPERSREDAVASVALREARARLAALEERVGGREAPERVEQQLAELRLLRAQLSRELQSAREQSAAIEEELRREQFERERLAEELENERAGSMSEQERLSERLQRANARVEYLERRVVEVQAQSARPGSA
jgi:hypothetical protein